MAEEVSVVYCITDCESSTVLLMLHAVTVGGSGNGGSHVYWQQLETSVP